MNTRSKQHVFPLYRTAFGMVMPEREYNVSRYRFGYNGKEMDNEVKGTGNSLDFGARIYDSRISRFSSIDPLAKKFPSESNYLYAGNNSILFIDEEGKRKTYYLTVITKTGKEITFKLVNSRDIRISFASTLSETFPTVRIKDIEQHIVMNFATGERSVSQEKVTGTYSLSFRKWSESFDKDFEGSGDLQNGGWTVTTSRQSIDPTKNKSKSYAPETNIDGLVVPSLPGRGITESIEELGEVNEDVKVVADIMSKSFEFGEKMIETVEFASKAKKTGENITIFKCGAGCNQTFQDSNGVITPSNKTPTETRQNHPE